MDEVIFGRIQGFLAALETLNTDVAQETENCVLEFTFYHVPETGYILTSLFNYIQQRIKTTAPGTVSQTNSGYRIQPAPQRSWDGYPVLEEIKEWEEHLIDVLNQMFFFSFKPVPFYGEAVLKGQSQCAYQFLQMLKQLFGSAEPKVWKLRWLKFDKRNSETYPWSVAYNNDYVFKCDEHIYHLTLIYTD